MLQFASAGEHAGEDGNRRPPGGAEAASEPAPNGVGIRFDTLHASEPIRIEKDES